MDKTLRWVVIGAAVAGMGISMPSCPGQQAMQQQVDTLEKKDAKMTETVRSLESEVKNLSAEMGQAKELLARMTDTIKEQQTAIQKLDESMKAAAARPAPKAAAAPAKAKAPAKKKKR